MAEKKKRAPSRATLATRAFGKVQRLRQQLGEQEAGKAKAIKRYDKRIAATQAKLKDAQAAFEQYASAGPDAAGSCWDSVLRPVDSAHID
jgi:hypothetical protein